MSDHPIEGMMNTTLEKIKQMVDVNTVVGDPITSPDGTIIIPVSKVAYGFASGGSDFPSKAQPAKEFFGGGAGAGITITPIAFLSICNGDVKLIQVEPFEGSADRIIQMVPDVVDKISETFSNKKEERAAKKEEKKAAKELEKLKEIIADVLNVEVNDITEDTTFVDDLGADSLDIFQIIMGIEETFDIEIDNDDAEQISTVGDAVEQIKNATNNN